LAATERAERNVRLAPFGSAWAAAWKASEALASGLSADIVQARTSAGASWTLRVPDAEAVARPFHMGAASERPAIAAVDGERLLVVTPVTQDQDEDGLADASQLMGCVLDVGQPGDVVASPLAVEALLPGAEVEPLFAGDVRLTALAQDRVVLAFATRGAQNAGDVWLSFGRVEAGPGPLEFQRGGAAMHWVFSTPAPPSMRAGAGEGAQARLSVAYAPAYFSQSPPHHVSGALILAWDDEGQLHAEAQAPRDVLIQFVPRPLLDP
jgi:hypothetical protein